MVDRIVPVRTWLTQPAYRRLTIEARKRETTVADLLSTLVDHATGLRPLRNPSTEPEPAEPEPRTYKRMTPSMIETARRRRAAGHLLSEIARDLGVSSRTVTRYAPNPERN